jgi:hypothetical protein
MPVCGCLFACAHRGCGPWTSVVQLIFFIAVFLFCLILTDICLSCVSVKGTKAQEKQ